MEFTDVIRRRRMVRRFVDRPLPSDVVERIVSNAMRVPSAGFSQGWAFLALTEEEDRKRFWPFVPNQAGYSPEIMHAPLVVIPLAHKGPYLEKYDRVVDGEDAWPAPYWFVDTGMSALMILLTAVDEGLGGFLFWIVPSADELIVSSRTSAHLAAFRAEFGIPDEYTPVGAIAIGYRPDDLAPQRPEQAAGRRDPDTLVHRGQWGQHLKTDVDNLTS